MFLPATPARLFLTSVPLEGWRPPAPQRGGFIILAELVESVEESNVATPWWARGVLSLEPESPPRAALVGTHPQPRPGPVPSSCRQTCHQRGSCGC